eukprot:COSAG05_NODE_337_length_11164_cov_11.970357_1_plen_37_part_00
MEDELIKETIESGVMVHPLHVKKEMDYNVQIIYIRD